VEFQNCYERVYTQTSVYSADTEGLQLTCFLVQLTVSFRLLRKMCHNVIQLTSGSCDRASLTQEKKGPTDDTSI